MINILSNHLGEDAPNPKLHSILNDTHQHALHVDKNECTRKVQEFDSMIYILWQGGAQKQQNMTKINTWCLRWVRALVVVLLPLLFLRLLYFAAERPVTVGPDTHAVNTHM